MGKKDIAIKLLRSRTARRLLMRGLKSERVRRLVAKQVARRLRGK